MAQKITPNIWFNGDAKEAIDFYVSVFPNSKILGGMNYPASKAEGLADFQKDLAGKPLTISYELAGFEFLAINAGPEFRPNPSISFFVNFDPSRDDQAQKHLDELWKHLSEGGEELMPLGEYPFSKHYGWVQDKYGVSWQLILTNPSPEAWPMIMPSLMFGKDKTNRAEEAMKFYTSLFEGSKVGTVSHYAEQTGPAKPGSLMYADFQLAGQWFAVMDAGNDVPFDFSNGVSLSIACDDQAEIDRFWESLSKVPEAEQCGWCVDEFGVSWQVVPANSEELLKRPNAFAHMMEMKKLVIADY